MEAKIKVEPLEATDPTFEGGSTHTATAVMTNPTAGAFTYAVELYLGVDKVVTSGVGSVAIPAGGSVSTGFTITMPVTEGDYDVFLDVSVAGELIAHYEATEKVTIEISPEIDIGTITWE